jgi:pilus assembly protein FimV
VWALGLGDIELDSALNQPLRAEILLVSATEEELSSLRVTLADQETFDRYGLDRPIFLEGIDFELDGNAPGGAIVSVSSDQPIAEPFVTILIEANWSRGRILREYTVLLDPPVLLPVPSVAETLTPAQSGASAAPQPAAAIDRPTPAALTPVTTPQAQTAPPPAQAAQPSPQRVTQAATTPASYGPVQSAETLWSIANRFRPAGVTMNQMMVGVYEANPQAFSGNMNTLHQGATLRLPQPAEFSTLSVAAATQEVQRQMALWEGGAEAQARLRLVTPEAATDISSGADSSAEGPTGSGFAGGTGGVDPSAAEVAELAGEVEALRAELDASQALLEIRDQQLQELQDQLRAVQEQQATPVTGAETATAPEPVASEAGVDLEEEPLFADEAATAEAEPEPAVTVPPAVTQVVTTSEPSLISRLLGWLGNPLLWIGLGLLSLVGAAAWFLRYRQQDVDDVTGRWEALEADLGEEDGVSREATDRIRQQQDVDDDTFSVEEEPGLDFEPVAEAEPDIGADDGAEDLDPSLIATTGAQAGEEEVPEQTLTIGVPPAYDGEPAADDTISSQTVINLEEADPIAEADFHMAYGLYDQAAELVEKALEAEPGRRDLTLKLLEVFFVWGNKDSFLNTAQSLHAEMGSSSDSDWDKVVIMGRQICPDDALFSAAPASAGAVDLDLDAGDAPELDVSFDAGGDAGVDLDFGDLGGGDVDLSLEPSSTMEQPPTDSLGDVDLDLDSGVSTEPASDDVLDLGLDVSATVEQASEDALDLDLEASGTLEQASEDALDLDLEASGTLEQASEYALDLDLEASGTLEQASEDALDLGDQTAAGLEAALIDPDAADDNAGNATDVAEAEIEEALSALPDVFDDLPDTESPVEIGEATGFDATAIGELDETETAIDDLAATQESPTVETPMSEPLDETSVATDVIEEEPLAQVDSTGQMPAIEEPVAAEAQDSGDRTAEIDLDDLGLDVEDLADLTGDLSVLAEAEDLESSDGDDSAIDEGVLSSEDVSEVLQEEDAEPLGDEDATLLASEYSDDDATGSTKQMEQLSAEDLGLGDLPDDVADALGAEAAEVTDATASINLDLADLESALEDSDTIEQPIAQSVGSDLLGGGGAPDLNLDAGTGNDATAARPGMLDPHTMTMTEVGTKLDLARAYMDMGDPDGARSILEEVIEEGDDNQQQEAKGLIDNL